MKKFLFAAFVAFWSAVVVLVVLDALVPAREVKGARETREPISEAVVKRHDNREDCWLIIEGGVYDITGYIPEHPAPDFVLTSWCGMDATEGMRTKGYGRNHSDAAWAKLEEYRIGELEGAGG